MSLFYRNLKNKKLYNVISDNVINATNSAPRRQFMMLYEDSNGKKYVRELDEFYERFDITDKESFE